MARKLKGVIIGITNVLVERGDFNEELFNEIGRLVKYLQSKEILPVFFGNHSWEFTSGKKKIDLHEKIRAEWGDFPYINAFRDGTPKKPSKAATQFIIDRFGWDQAEVVYVGNSESDMRTAVNGNLLFLNATWYTVGTDYGFLFSTPLDIARFIDTFCLRDSLWHYSIENKGLRYYALSPYSTYIQEFESFSSDAKKAAKWGGGHPDFWTKYLLSTIYFSELYKETDYIAVVPGHKQGSGNPIMEEPTSIFAKCFRQRVLKDFIYRHTTIEPSHIARRNPLTVIDHSRQLNSIQLNEHPQKTPTDIYKTCPVKKGKTVLLLDDICTNGYTLEAARAYIEQTGANTICITWLKTINSQYEQIIDLEPEFNPFVDNQIKYQLKIENHNYADKITDQYAPDEVTHKLQAYDRWQWP